MPIDQDKHHKQDALRQHATLNPRAHGVTHELFTSNEFFDPHDVLQVKFEMLRLVSIDKRSISEAARACGFSRPSFYQAMAAFESDGLAGLLAHKSGPHGGHRLTPAVLQFIGEARAADPDIHAQRLAELVLQTFGVQVHPRSIERKLLRKKNSADARVVSPTATRRESSCTLRGSTSAGAWPIRRSTSGFGFVHPSRYVRVDTGVEAVCGADTDTGAASG